MDWALAEDNTQLLNFTRDVIAMRKHNPVFRRRRFFEGNPDHLDETELGEIAWFTPSAEHMSGADWSAGYSRSVAMFLNGEAIVESDDRGERVIGDSFLLLFNAHHEDIDFVLPDGKYGDLWSLALDTAMPQLDPEVISIPAGKSVTVTARSIIVMRREDIDA